MPQTWNRSALARVIDHTVLKPEASAAQLDQLCDECQEFGFVAACVQPSWVERCVRRLSGSGVLVATVAGFPHGAALPEIKALEAARAVEQGALEVDMVIHLAALLAADAGAVASDIEAVVSATRRANPAALVKVILETALLDESQIALGCRCARDSGAAFVKTSTGFHPAGGAQAAQVALLRRYAGGMRVKAAGGIRDLPTALAMLEAGADRLGMSASVAVVNALPAP